MEGHSSQWKAGQGAPFTPFKGLRDWVFPICPRFPSVFITSRERALLDGLKKALAHLVRDTVSHFGGNDRDDVFPPVHVLRERVGVTQGFSSPM